MNNFKTLLLSLTLLSGSAAIFGMDPHQLATQEQIDDFVARMTRLGQEVHQEQKQQKEEEKQAQARLLHEAQIELERLEEEEQTQAHRLHEAQIELEILEVCAKSTSAVFTDDQRNELNAKIKHLTTLLANAKNQ